MPTSWRDVEPVPFDSLSKAKPEVTDVPITMQDLHRLDQLADPSELLRLKVRMREQQEKLLGWMQARLDRGVPLAVSFGDEREDVKVEPPAVIVLHNMPTFDYQDDYGVRFLVLRTTVALRKV